MMHGQKIIKLFLNMFQMSLCILFITKTQLTDILWCVIQFIFLY